MLKLKLNLNTRYITNCEFYLHEVRLRLPISYSKLFKNISYSELRMASFIRC